MQQIICIHVGQCGLQVGSALWELLTYEHSITADGLLHVRAEITAGVDTLFHRCLNGQHVPRALFADLEPTVMDSIRCGTYRKLYHPDQLINSEEDAANNFARGFYTSGQKVKVMCEHQIRREIEKTENLQAIHVYRALGGGTGSGLTACLFEMLSEYAKIKRIEIPIHPSPHLTNAVVEPYNCILSEHFCIDDIDMSLLMDNESLYDISSQEVQITKPTYYTINRIVVQVCSSMTSSSRFRNDLYNDFNIMTNLVPYPRIHFPLVSYAPFGNAEKLSKNTLSVPEITRAVFWSGSQMVKCDPSIGRFMSCSLLYRGDISPTDVYEALAEIKASSLIKFVDWCPTGFKVGIVKNPPQILPESQAGLASRNVIMLTNNSSVSSVWHRLSQRFHKLYSKRSFVHWFVAEGLEESEFCESLYNIATLAKDYEEVSLDTEQNMDDDKYEDYDDNPELPEGQQGANINSGTTTSKESNRMTDEEPSSHAKVKNNSANNAVTPRNIDDSTEGTQKDTRNDENIFWKDMEVNGARATSAVLCGSDCEYQQRALSKHEDNQRMCSQSTTKNLSNVLSFDSGSIKLNFSTSITLKRDIKKLFQTFRVNYSNMLSKTDSKNESLLGHCQEVQAGRHHIKKVLKEQPLSYFDSGLYKKIFIKKCARQGRCLEEASDQEGSRSMMENLIMKTEKI